MPKDATEVITREANTDPDLSPQDLKLLELEII